MFRCMFLEQTESTFAAASNQKRRLNDHSGSFLPVCCVKNAVREVKCVRCETSWWGRTKAFLNGDRNQKTFTFVIRDWEWIRKSRLKWHMMKEGKCIAQDLSYYERHVTAPVLKRVCMAMQVEWLYLTTLIDTLISYYDRLDHFIYHSFKNLDGPYFLSTSFLAYTLKTF